MPSGEGGCQLFGLRNVQCCRRGPDSLGLSHVRFTKNADDGDRLIRRESNSYALIGGFALAAQGIHRATADIDFLVDGGRRKQVLGLLTQNGFVTTMIVVASSRIKPTFKDWLINSQI